jgi:hypothetical protein
MNSTALTESQRARLALFSDALISGSPGWPSASAADADSKWIERALAARPDLVTVVLAVVEQSGEPQDVLRGLDRATFDSFSTLIAGTYLMNPEVRRKLGLPAGPPERNPPYPDEADYYLEGGLLDPVMARGSAGFRRTPGTH